MYALCFALISLILLNGISAQYCSHREKLGALGRNIKPLYRALSDDIVNYINDVTNSTWSAKPSDRFKSVSEIKRVLGVNPDPNRFKLPKLCKLLSPNDKKNIPATFDARTNWDKCNSIKTIKNNGECGSSWASASIDAISDRLCIHKSQELILSPSDVVSCCGPLCGSGCDGGIPAATWDYWVYYGLVSGGKDGCMPSPFNSCTNFAATKDMPACKGDQIAPACSKQCREGYGRKYEEDKTYGVTAYSLRGNETQIQHEIFKNGPVQTDFEVYADFIHYDKGIYEHRAGPLLGYHSVKIVGWGEEKKVPYWLAANSWGPTWGEDGFFRIKRGKNMCGFETDVNAGMPK